MLGAESSRPAVTTTSLSRRRALLAAAAAGGASLAGIGPARGQDSTPAGDDEAVSLLLVQSCDAGRAEPVAGNPGAFTLTLDHASRQTLYFSDRPVRIASLLDTATLLSDGTLFGGDPPNAALAFHGDGAAGIAEVATLELAHGEIDPANGTVTYRAMLLPVTSDDRNATPASFAVVDELPATFGHAWLFIDDYRHHYNTNPLKLVSGDIIITP